MNQAKIRKFEFAEKILFKNGNFIKVKEYQIPEYLFTTKCFQMIVSCVRIKIRLILKKYSKTSLNSKGNKKGSLYLDTLKTHFIYIFCRVIIKMILQNSVPLLKLVITILAIFNSIGKPEPHLAADCRGKGMKNTKSLFQKFSEFVAF